MEYLEREEVAQLLEEKKTGTIPESILLFTLHMLLNNP
jgi:hypothetical protein